jgi:hypothetical protein
MLMCLYDTMCSFTTILLGSLVTDSHHMNDPERVRFMASGQIANLVAAFAVAQIGLEVLTKRTWHIFEHFYVFWPFL